MSFNTKTIMFSVAALLAVAGGVYSFMPGEQKGASDSSERTGSVRTSAKPQATDSRNISGGQASEKANVQVAEASVEQPSTVVEQPMGQAPKKLTRAQLLPPPATEEEKLQKAAEQESNF